MKRAIVKQAHSQQEGKPSNNAFHLGRPGVSSLLLAFFYCAFIFKALPVIGTFPVDLTFLIAILLSIYVIANFVKFGIEPQTLVILGGLFFVFIPGILINVTQGNLDTASTEKIAFFFTLNLLAVFAPAILIRSREDLGEFTFAILIILALSVIINIPQLLISSELGRLRTNSGNTVGFSRIISLFALYIYWLIRYRKINFVLAIAILVFLSFMLLSIGSRGPLIALLIAIGLFHLSSNLLQIRTLQYVVVFFVIFALINMNQSIIPQSALQRVTEFFNNPLEENTSTEARLLTYQDAGAQIIENPLGLGLGNYQYAFFWGYDNSNVLSHPHNIFLEVFVEGGWIAGLYYISVICYAFILLYKLSRIYVNDLAILFLVSSVLLLFISALFSGDLLANRYFMGLLGLTIAFYQHTKSTGRMIRTSSKKFI